MHWHNSSKRLLTGMLHNIILCNIAVIIKPLSPTLAAEVSLTQHLQTVYMLYQLKSTI